MTYPDRVFPQHDYARDQRQGDDIKGTDLNGDFARLSTAINQLNSFVRGVTTSDGKLNTLNAVRQLDVITTQLNSGDGATVTFPLLLPIDPVVDLVRAWISGVLTPPLSYTSTTVTFAVAPPGGVNNIEFRIYTNMAGVLDRIQSLVELQGASFVGYDDPEARYLADNVRDALTEVKRVLDDFMAAVGDPEDTVLRDGTRTLTGQWEVNDRSSVTIPPVAATGSFNLTGQPADGDTVTIADNFNTFTYEFDNNAVITPGNIAVTIGATRDATAANLLAAINNSPLAITASGVSTVPAFSVQLANQVPGVAGNTPILFVCAVISAVLGMSGGVDGSFSAAYKTHFMVRNHPPSIRDGDVVVHEQLAALLAQIAAFVDAFLRVDGSNQMVNDLDAGGNQVINLAPGVAGTDAVNKSQLDAVDDRIDTDTLAPDGLKDSGVRGTITGPLTLGQLATDNADVDQVSAPASVTVHTIAGVPRASSPDQPVNLQQLTETLGALAGVSLKSPYAALTTIIRNTTLLGTDGAVGNIATGGTFLATTVTIAAPMAPLRDTFINATGDVTINSTITMPNNVLEISTDGNVNITGAIVARDIRIRASGGITTSIGGTLTANADFGVVALDSLGGGGLNIAGAITAPLIFAYAFAASVVSSTWLARVAGAAGSRWPEVVAGNMLQTLDTMVGGRWGERGVGRFGARDMQYLDSQNGAFLGVAVTLQPRGVKDDYMSQFSGVGGNRGVSFPGPGSGPNTNGFGGGGSGASGGGNGGNATGSVAGTGGAAPQAGVPRAYLLPAAPGGGAGAGMDDVGATFSPPAPIQFGGAPGGVIVLAVNAALNLTGASLQATGANGGGTFGAGSAGGGGGGTVKVSARGTITGGTISANGGTGNLDGGGGQRSGGGGGGVAFMLAPTFAGVQTATATGAATGGAAGQSSALVVPLATLDAWLAEGMLQK